MQMENNWLPSGDELDNPKVETVEERLRYTIETTQQYILGVTEAKQRRNKAYKEKQDRNPMRYIRAFRKKGRELTLNNQLSLVERGFLFTLQYWVAPENCLLVDSNNIPLTKEKIMSMTMLKKTKFYEVVSKLKSMGIMGTIEDGNKTYYTLSPEYFDYL